MLDRIGGTRMERIDFMEDIHAFIDKVGCRYVPRMCWRLRQNVCSNQEELERFLKLAANVSKKHPVVVSQFIEHAKKWNGRLWLRMVRFVAYAISEHIEYAGVHSGDATIQFHATAKAVCGNGAPHQAHLPSDSQGIEYFRSVQYPISGKG